MVISSSTAHTIIRIFKKDKQKVYKYIAFPPGPLIPLTTLYHEHSPINN